MKMPQSYILDSRRKTAQPIDFHKVFEILNIVDLEGRYSKYLDIETEKFKRF